MSVKYDVLEGITDSQISELIIYSKNDPLIAKYTHDPQRFEDFDVFKKWETGKRIYTLNDKTKKLLGIVWFEKKSHSNALGYPFTFAIRIYPIARGKGLSQVLMKSAFAKFMDTKIFRSSSEKGIWLLTRKDNEVAIKLYKNFGFEKILTDKDGYTLMTYKPS